MVAFVFQPQNFGKVVFYLQMIFCQSVSAVRAVSILVGVGDTYNLTTTVEFMLIFALRG